MTGKQDSGANSPDNTSDYRVSSNVQNAFKTLLADPKVKKGLVFIKKDEKRRIKDQVEISEIPSSPFHERQRAENFMMRFKAVGLKDVHIDNEGNVIGAMRGSGGIPKLVISAHLDTVFPPGYNPKVTVDDKGVLHGPGIADDAGGLAAILSIALAFKESDLQPVGDILFVGTVGEEGRGDLRGVKHLFSTVKDIDGFISIDGGGTDQIIYSALGSKRFEITFKGAGGHSFGAFGEVANPLHAMGRAVNKIANIQVPQNPRTSFAVTIVNGGTSVNAIPGEVNIQTDIRSECSKQIDKTVTELINFVKMGVVEENVFWKIPRNSPANVQVEIRKIGDRPAYSCPDDALQVQIAYAATRAIGQVPVLKKFSSTDASLPISLGVPAVTIGRGGKEIRTHSLGEAFDPKGAYRSSQRVFLTALAFVGIKDKMEPLLDKHPGYTYKFKGVESPSTG